MGRHSANEGFLSAFSKYAQLDKTFSYVPEQQHHQHFVEKYKYFEGNAKEHGEILFDNPDQLREPGCLYIPDPNLAAQAKIRDRIQIPKIDSPHKLYSLCGVTHTLSSEGAISLIRQLLLSPVQQWDALVCTSNAVKSVVENLFGFYGEYYGEKNVLNPCQLPVIPLGVTVDKFLVGKQREELRQRWRKKLNISENAVVFLFFGRLSFHAKANPYSMFAALEAAKAQTNKDIHLLMVGQYANEAIEKSFLKAQKLICPSITCHQLDGGDTQIRSEIWYAADVFTSLVDNIQETFGLTPIEAMAAGLPVVVTDWDGYKDTVQHEKQGFRVPTLIPAANTIGLEFAQRHYSKKDNYDYYIANVANHVAVDIPATVSSYVALIEQKELREKMGHSARMRAEKIYDWKHIIHRYQDLWGELAEIRQSSDQTVIANTLISTSRQTKPPFMDPFQLFNHYPSSQLDLHNGAIIWNKGFSIRHVKRLFKSEILHSTVDAPFQIYLALHQKLQHGSYHKISSLLKDQSKQVQLDILKCIARCLKVGAVNYRIVQSHSK